LVKSQPRSDDFSIFQDGGRGHLIFSKYGNFRGLKGQDSQNTLFCQISRRFVKLLLRYGDFSILEHGGRRHLGFLKLQIFNGRDAEVG